MLDDLKILLGLDPENEDEKLDEKLGLIIRLTKNRLSAMIGESVPSELEYIVTEVAVVRFNRIGSEGYSSHSVEGESISFADNDFAPFMDDINRYLENKNSYSMRGGFKFL